VDDRGHTALKATGGSTSACLEPASIACLTYAYALYDLAGRFG